MNSSAEAEKAAAAAKEEEADSDGSDADEHIPLADIETQSTMAENIKIFLLTQSNTATLPVKRKENLLPRTFYEFNLRSRPVNKASKSTEDMDVDEIAAEAAEEEEDDPLPLTIMKSKKVIF